MANYNRQEIEQMPVEQVIVQHRIDLRTRHNTTPTRKSRQVVVTFLILAICTLTLFKAYAHAPYSVEPQPEQSALVEDDTFDIESMYGALDKDGKYRAMQEQLDQMLQKTEQYQEEESQKRSVALWISILIGLIPLIGIGIQIIRGRTWRTNPTGTVKALVVGLAGACALFGINYFVLIMKIIYGSRFSIIFVVATMIFLIIAAIYILIKKPIVDKTDSEPSSDSEEEHPE